MEEQGLASRFLFFRVQTWFLPLGFVGLSGALAHELVGHQFGGYDLSPLIDLAWRLQVGQVPNEDFLTTFPLGFMFLGKTLGAFTELSWTSYTVLSIVITLSCLAIVLLSIRLDPSPKRVDPWLFSLAFSIPLLFTNHIWHSTYSQLFASVFLLNMFIALRSDQVHSRFLILLSAAMLSMAKQNVSLPIFFLTLAVVLLSWKKVSLRWLGLWVTIGYFAGIAGSAYFLGLSFHGLLYVYTGGASRLIPSEEMISAILDAPGTPFVLFMLALAFLAVLVSRSKTQAFSRDQIYLLTVTALGLLPFLTDWDFKLNNMPMVLVSIGLFLFSYSVDDFRGALSHLLFWLAVGGTFIAALSGGIARDRMQEVGPFFQSPATVVVYSHLFDRGLRTGDVFEGILEEIQKLKNENLERVFFGPRLEFAYYELQVASPLGMPLYWFPGTSFAVSDTEAVEESFRATEFEALVFFDYTRMPSSILSYIEVNFEVDTAYSKLIVYRPVS